MRREEMIKKAYDYSKKLSMSNEKYTKMVCSFLSDEFNDDLGSFYSMTQKLDATTQAIFQENNPRVFSEIIAKEEGVVAGIEETVWFYEANGLKVNNYIEDGAYVKKGDKVMRIEGYIKDMLKTERIALNFMQRMSGVATATKKLKDLVEEYGTAVVATRKTQQRFFDKRAVTLGGGYAHRLSLYDGILIKDNHLDAIKQEYPKNYISEAIKRASKYKEHKDLKFIEIEVTNYDEAIEAARSFKEKISKSIPSIIMLDNMEPREIKKIVLKLKKECLYDYVLLEASGMINEKNIKGYAKAEVDAVSMGCLTHSVKALDLSQKMVKHEN